MSAHDVLRQYALGIINHRYMGECPDLMFLGDSTSRDPECAVCQAIDAPLGDALPGGATE